MNFRGTALFYACAEGSMKVVMQLLEAGADPAVQRTGANKRSPFEAAVENGHQNLISILQKLSAAGICGRIDAPPAYLRESATAKELRGGDAVEMPQVEVRADHGVRGVAKRRGRDREREDESGMEGSGGVVARHVLQELSGELFVELMGMCELAAIDAEDDVEEGSDGDDDDDADSDDAESESASGGSDAIYEDDTL